MSKFDRSQAGSRGLPQLKLKPYAGQTASEVKAWMKSKYPRGLTEKTSRAYAAELYQDRPDHKDDPQRETDWYSQLTDLQKEILADAKRQKLIAADERLRVKFRDKYNLSDDESREFWKYRGQPKLPDEKQSEWERITDKLRKRLKAPPRKRKKRSYMTETEWDEHNRKLARERQAKSRAKQKAGGQSEVRAAPLSEDEAIVELNSLLSCLD